MYTEGVPGSPGAGAREHSPWAMGSLAKAFPKPSSCSLPSLRDTKVTRYKQGQRSELFNDTKIIMNKTVNVSPVASSPS